METKVVNNDFYDHLGNQWYEASDHPVALLRAENRARIPWIVKKITDAYCNKKCAILDIGCGGGFLTNALASLGHHVAGIDLSQESLEIARLKDETRTVQYCQGNGYALPFGNNHFETVCAMDLLEHVSQPGQIILEASRVLKPGGIFFFHTFNRTVWSWLFALKGIEWFVPNTPPRMHVYKYFIKPNELTTLLNQHQLSVCKMHGLMPAWNKAFFQLLIRRRIPEGFAFKIKRSLSCGYMGFAQKRLFH
jgi:2-polyprenyl-6-hydroxyphenyl methylase / 3-demethylubiquinone-9 3-methyltransferase